MLTSLIENLKKVKDFRKSQGKRYELWEVLLVVVLGVIGECGLKGKLITADALHCNVTGNIFKV